MNIRLSPNQTKCLGLIEDPSIPIVMVSGPAGSGKSHLAVQGGMRSGKKLVFTRPYVTANENLGHLPGNIDKKTEPFFLPLYDLIVEHGRTEKQMKSQGRLELAPLGFLRGRTFKNSYIIADEMQNATGDQIRTLMTRIGENTKLVLTGDPSQCDIHEDTYRRLFNYVSEAYEGDSIRTCELTDEDIFRHDAIRDVLEIFSLLERYKDTPVFDQ